MLPLIVATIPKNKGEVVRVGLESFKGFDLVSARVFVTGDGEPRPTTKGLSLRVSMLPDLLAALEDAKARAEELGLLASPERSPVSGRVVQQPAEPDFPGAGKSRKPKRRRKSGRVMSLPPISTGLRDDDPRLAGCHTTPPWEAGPDDDLSFINGAAA